MFEELPQYAFKFQTGIKACRRSLALPRDGVTKPEIYIYWSKASGTGKTSRAVKENPDAYIFTKPRDKSTVFWNGYMGETTVIFDEFYGWIPYDSLLRILDWYPMNVETKGDFMPLSATKFIFTSNKPWEEWYPNINNTNALKRRIEEFGTIICFDDNNDDQGEIHYNHD